MKEKHPEKIDAGFWWPWSFEYKENPQPKCPNCGSKNIEHELSGYAGVDRNKADCKDCKWSGILEDCKDANLEKKSHWQKFQI